MAMVVEVIADGANGRKRSHANITLDLELRQTYLGSQYNTSTVADEAKKSNRLVV